MFPPFVVRCIMSAWPGGKWKQSPINYPNAVRKTTNCLNPSCNFFPLSLVWPLDELVSFVVKSHADPPDADICTAFASGKHMSQAIGKGTSVAKCFQCDHQLVRNWPLVPGPGIGFFEIVGRLLSTQPNPKRFLLTFGISPKIPQV